MNRITITADGPVDIVVKVTALAARYGATSFELAYTAADRDLEDGEEPRPDEPVKWTATAVIHRKSPGRKATLTTYVGEAIVAPGQDHGTRGGAACCIDLAEKLGANVIVVDLGDTTDPRDTPTA